VSRRLLHLLHRAKRLASLGHGVVGLLLLHLVRRISRPLFFVHVSDSLQLQLKLHDLLVSKADLLLRVGYLAAHHQLGTLRPDSGSSEGWLEGSLCIGVVTLLEDLTSQVVLFHF